MKRNHLLEKVANLLKDEQPGKLLDVGCGDGNLSQAAKALGFNVIAADLDNERFKFNGDIEFRKVDLNKALPFSKSCFEYVIAMEVIEHLDNLTFFIEELNRILIDNGVLIISTPNMLNLKSRIRFLFEGTFDYFREPPLEQFRDPKSNNLNIHINICKLQELEYILFKNKFKIEKIATSLFEPTAIWFSFIIPLMKLQMCIKRHQANKKGNIDYSRIHSMLLTREILYGRHLIIKARKV